MRWGIIALYCPICGTQVDYNGNISITTYHHKKFGVVCSEGCFRKAENKYAKMILGKDDDECLGSIT